MLHQKEQDYISGTEPKFTLVWSPIESGVWLYLRGSQVNIATKYSLNKINSLIFKGGIFGGHNLCYNPREALQTEAFITDWSLFNC